MGKEASKNVLEGFQRANNIETIEKYFQWNLITRDPDDNKFVDCAIAGNADYLVTNDSHFNVLKTITFPQVEILTADEFMDLLRTQ